MVNITFTRIDSDQIGRHRKYLRYRSTVKSSLFVRFLEESVMKFDPHLLNFLN